jgi:hypothetical protein
VTKAPAGVVTRIYVQAGGYDFVDGEALTITGGTGTGLAGTALVPSNQFFYGFGNVNAARKFLLNNEEIAAFDYVYQRLVGTFDVIEVQDSADPAAFSDALGNGIVNVGAAFYVRNTPTWQYKTTPGKIVQNRDFGHRATAIAFADTPYTMDGLSEILIVNATGGNITINLPSAAFFGTGYGSRVIVRRTDATGNTVTIARAGSDTVDGAAAITLAASTGKTLISNGSTAWYSL